MKRNLFYVIGFCLVAANSAVIGMVVVYLKLPGIYKLGSWGGIIVSSCIYAIGNPWVINYLERKEQESFFK